MNAWLANCRSAELCRLLIVGCLLALHARTTVGEEPSRGPSFPRIANVYGTTFTREGASFHGDHRTLEEVARYDLLIGVQRQQGNDPDGSVFRKHLEKLKQINPHLIALQFTCSAPYTRIAPPETVLETRQPNQIFPWLLQTDGTPIAGWPGTYMLNLAAPGVVNWLAHQTLPAVKRIGYDGVFIDCMGPHFDSWACEIATGKPYTVDCNADGKDDDRGKLTEIWSDAKTELARRTRQLIGPQAVFMANQAGPDTYDQLNGIYLEDYIDAILDRGMSWETVLEKYLHWAETPQRPNVTVLGCGSGVEPPFEPFQLSQETRASYLERGKARVERMRFGLATALMGNGYYSFDLHTRWRGQYWWYPEFDVPLGYPKGPCRRQEDGTWCRQFDGGLVVVNPTRWDARVEFDQMHRDVSSGQTDHQFVLPRLDGRIYLPSDGPVHPGNFPAIAPQLTSTGPAGVIERDGVLALRDGRSVGVLIDSDASIKSLCWNGRELIDSIAPVIVSDARWQNFSTKELRHQVGRDGSVTMTGQRTDGEQILEFTETIQLANARLEVDYHWRAETPLQLRAFRQSVRFSPREFGGKVLTAGDNGVHLPQTTPDDPNLAQSVTLATLPIADQHALTIRLPQTGHLIDDRYYHGAGYLLAFYPISGAVPQGQEWSYSIEITCDHAEAARSDNK